MKTNVSNSILVLLMLTLTIGCKSDKKTETSEVEETKESSQMAVTYNVNLDESKINWEGSKPAGVHYGEVDLKEGTVMVTDGNIESGNFVIDMTTINVQDLEGQDKKDLENHLMGYANGKEDHFFNVTKYPEAKFEITNINNVDGNTILSGNLTLKETSKNISFPVETTFNDAENSMQLISDEIIIDRTEWGIKFMSKSFIENLGDNFVSDDMKITFEIKAEKAE